MESMMEREFKSTTEHWSIVLDYFEQNPRMLRTKFQHSDGDSRETKQKWEELSNQLNSLGYGRKTVEKWQLAIGRWRSKVKAKAVQIRLEMNGTGGGAAKATPLTELEERLMAVMGWKYIEGDKNMELGIMPSSSTNNVQQSPQPTQRPVPNNEACSKQAGDKNRVVGILSCSSTHHVEKAPKQPPPLLTVQKRPASGNEPCTKRKVPRRTEQTRKFVTLTQMNSENVTVLNNINKNLANLTTAVVDLVNIFKNYTEKN